MSDPIFLMTWNGSYIKGQRSNSSNKFSMFTMIHHFHSIHALYPRLYTVREDGGPAGKKPVPNRNFVEMFPGPHINSNKLDNPHQFVYKLGHSTETALLSIKNEVQLSLARGEQTTLMLLGLLAAFGTVDHNPLLGYLKSWFCFGGTILKWFVF